MYKKLLYNFLQLAIYIYILSDVDQFSYIRAIHQQYLNAV